MAIKVFENPAVKFGLKAIGLAALTFVLAEAASWTINGLDGEAEHATEIAKLTERGEKGAEALGKLNDKIWGFNKENFMFNDVTSLNQWRDFGIIFGTVALGGAAARRAKLFPL